MRTWTLTSSGPEETARLGAALGALLTDSTIILLVGDLGAGKTCFTQGLARGLGVRAEEPVTSPSYTLMNHYRGRLDLYHFDLYRLCGADDLVEIGFDDIVHGPGVTVVEWADRIPELELEGLTVAIGYQDENRRRLELTVSGGEDALLARLIADWTREGGAE